MVPTYPETTTRPQLGLDRPSCDSEATLQHCHTRLFVVSTLSAWPRWTSTTLQTSPYEHGGGFSCGDLWDLWGRFPPSSSSSDSKSELEADSMRTESARRDLGSSVSSPSCEDGVLGFSMDVGSEVFKFLGSPGGH